METILIKIKRQDDPEGLPYWEEFAVDLVPTMTVVAAIEAIRENPVTSDGNPTTPVVWEGSCLEGACGACAMLINGKARLACSTFIEELGEPVVLEPLSSFPIVRDLKVDRSRMFETLSRTCLWNGIDGLGRGETSLVISAEEQFRLARFSSCIMCGACAEACPQVNERSQFPGAYLFPLAVLFNSHPTGKLNTGPRMDALMQRGGLADCAGAQACEAVCPRGIPISEAGAMLAMTASLHWVKRLLWG